MTEFATAFHDALRSGAARELAGFCTEDALLIHPLIHQGTVLYGNYDRTIQIRGRDSITRFFETVADILPDGKDSTLTHVVGSIVGGGIEWKAGGLYAHAGLDRTGLVGCTSLNLFGGRIQRMGVRFDTFQMPQNILVQVKTALRRAGVVD